MLKKLFIILFLSLFCNILAEGAQSQSQNIAVIKSSDINPFNTVIAEFKRSCRCRVTEYDMTEDQAQVTLNNIRSTKPAAVFVVGAEAFTLVRGITDIPVIYSMVMIPGYSPEDNRIGVVMEVSPEKQLVELLNVLPATKRVGVVYDPRKTAHLVKNAIKAANTMGVKLIPKEVYSPKKTFAAISSIKNEIDAIWLLPDPIVLTQETVEFMLLFSLENNIPIFTFSEKYVRLGALMSLSPDPSEVGEKAGAIARRILAGEDLRDIKPGAVDKTILSLNTSVANKLGIAVSRHIIDRAYIVNTGAKNR